MKKNMQLENSYGYIPPTKLETIFSPLPEEELSKNIYVKLFGDYPSFASFDFAIDDKNINVDVIYKYVKENIKDEIVRIIQDVEISQENNKKEINYNSLDNRINYIFICRNRLVVKLYSDGLIYFNYDEGYHNINDFNEIIYNAKQKPELYRDIEKSNMIHFIVQTQKGLSLEDHISKNKNEIDIDKNYNDDFKEADEKIKNYITKNKNGLILLYGEPGTGKTYYLRHLTKYSEDKKFIFLPSTLSNALSDPGFVSFAIKELQNSVLIIEDAENVIQKRGTSFGGQSQQSVANLLNLSDGLMSDVLNLQIICTFNSSINEIDPALTRKGRLLLQYRFKKLEVNKTNELLESLGKNHRVNEETTLADVYNIEDDNGEENKQTNTIGFKNYD